MPKERYPQPNKEQAMKHCLPGVLPRTIWYSSCCQPWSCLSQVDSDYVKYRTREKATTFRKNLANDQMTQSKCRLLHLLSVFLCLLPHFFFWSVLSVQFSPVQSLCRVWLCDPMDCSSPGFPVHHQLPELTQTHVHWVSDAIQPSHPLLSPSPPTFSLSQHQGLFQWVSSLHQVAKVLKFRLQHQSFQWIFRTDFL